MLARCVRRARKVVRGGRSGLVLGRRRQRDGCGSGVDELCELDIDIKNGIVVYDMARHNYACSGLEVLRVGE